MHQPVELAGVIGVWPNRPDLGPSWQRSVFNTGQTHNRQKSYIGCSERTLDPCPISGPNKFPHSAPFLILRISSVPHVYVRQFLDFLEPKIPISAREYVCAMASNSEEAIIASEPAGPNRNAVSILAIRFRNWQSVASTS